jgi:hypothetical protein
MQLMSVSIDRKEAEVSMGDRTFTLYHSDGLVLELFDELFTKPAELAIRCDEKTEEIEIQLNLFKEAV